MSSAIKLSRCKSSVSQIAFVASKADKVHEDDRENLKTLLTDLVEPLTRNSELAKKAAFYNCISVNSTQSLKDGDHILFGRPIWKREDDGGVRKLTPSDPPQQLKVSQLPSHWPDRWSGADYSFYDFYPTIPAKRGNLPKQNGLERVMEFILNGVEETK